jgi:diaminopimelate epimerase
MVPFEAFRFAHATIATMLDFVKMQGTGNDFVLVDARGVNRDWVGLAQRICDRHYGVGGDGLLLILPSRNAPIRMRIFNPDGSEAQMCGNGIRCFAKYVLERKLVAADSGGLDIETLAGTRTVTATWKDGKVVAVRVGMGIPKLKPAEVPIDLSKAAHPTEAPREGPLLDYPLHVNDTELHLTAVSMGNPHAVAFLHSPIASFPLEHIGPLVEHHPLFPERTNFEVAQVADKTHVQVRVWERGAGPTMACGTGAAAVAVAARLHGFVGDKLEVELPGGPLELEWDGKGEVWLTGPAVEVFSGQWPE